MCECERGEAGSIRAQRSVGPRVAMQRVRKGHLRRQTRTYAVKPAARKLVGAYDQTFMTAVGSGTHRGVNPVIVVPVIRRTFVVGVDVVLALRLGKYYRNVIQPVH